MPFGTPRNASEHALGGCGICGYGGHQDHRRDEKKAREFPTAAATSIVGAPGMMFTEAIGRQ